jgi:putative transposase
MILTYKYKLYKTKRLKHLHRTINIAGIIYNHCIALHKRYYKLYGKSLNKYQLQKHLTKLKKLPKYFYWKKVPSQAIQDITDRIDKAYKLFFRNQKQGIHSSPPSFKKVKKYKSFTLKQAGYKIDGNVIYLNGYKYKFWLSRPIVGKIKTITVKRDNVGDFYICISLEQDETQKDTASGKIVGIDFGLKTFLTLSDNTECESPRYYLKHLKELKRLQLSGGSIQAFEKARQSLESIKFSLPSIDQSLLTQIKDNLIIIRTDIQSLMQNKKKEKEVKVDLTHLIDTVNSAIALAREINARAVKDELIAFANSLQGKDRNELLKDLDKQALTSKELVLVLSTIRKEIKGAKR